MQLVVDLAYDQLTALCGQTHGEEELLTGTGRVLAVQGFEQAVLSLWGQAEDSVGCLSEE